MLDVNVRHISDPMRALVARASNDLDMDRIVERHRELMAGEGEAAKVLAHLFDHGISKRTLDHFKVGVAHPSQRFRHVGYVVPYAEHTFGHGTAMGTATGARLCNIHRRPERRVAHAGSTARPFNVDDVRGAEYAVVTDTELDALAAWQMGVRNVTVFAWTHLDGLKVALRDCKRIILWLTDNDVRRVADIFGASRCRSVNTTVLSAEQAEKARANAAEMNATRIGACDVLHALGDDQPGQATFRSMITSAHPVSRGGIVTLDHYQDSLLGMLDKSAEEITGKLTGLRAFDNLVRGMRAELRVVTGREGEGKSEFCDWLHAQMAMSHGDPVLIISPENGAAAVAQKHFKRLYGAPITEVRTDEQKAKARKVISELGTHPIYVMDVTGSVDFGDVIDTIHKGVEDHGVKHILLDHWQWFTPRTRVKDDTEAIKGFLRELVPLPEKLGAGITMIAQPRHNVQVGHIPGPQDLYGGASVKQACMTGISIWRDKDGNTATNAPRNIKVTTPTGAKSEVTIQPNQAYIHVWKSRSDAGTTGACIVDFDRRSATYSDVKSVTADEPPQQDAEDQFSFGTLDP